MRPPLDSARLPMRACIYLTKKINKLKLLIKIDENLTKTKLMF